MKALEANARWRAGQPPASSTLAQEVVRRLRVLACAIRLYLKAFRVYSHDFALQLIIYPMQMLAVWYLWRAALATGAIRGASSEHTLAYYATVFLLVRVVDLGRLALELEEEIHSGHLLVYLSRPIYHWQILTARTAARALVGIGIGLPLLLLFIPLGVKQPLTAAGTAGLLVTGLLGILLEFMIYYSIGLSAFWVDRIWGVMLATQFIMSLLGGRLLPIHFYPDWFQTALPYLPFRYAVYEPVMLFLGEPSWWQIGRVAAIQTLWLLTIGTLTVVLWRLGTRRFVGEGT